MAVSACSKASRRGIRWPDGCRLSILLGYSLVTCGSRAQAGASSMFAFHCVFATCAHCSIDPRRLGLDPLPAAKGDCPLTRRESEERLFCRKHFGGWGGAGNRAGGTLSEARHSRPVTCSIPAPRRRGGSGIRTDFCFCFLLKNEPGRKMNLKSGCFPFFAVLSLFSLGGGVGGKLKLSKRGQIN